MLKSFNQKSILFNEKTISFEDEIQIQSGVIHKLLFPNSLMVYLVLEDPLPTVYAY